MNWGSMAEVRDNALLLRRIPYSDTSLVCHFLTGEHGRIALMARGARRAKSPFRGALEPLYLLNIRWRMGRTGMGTLVDVERGSRLLNEVQDLDGLELCALASGLFQEGDPHGYNELVDVMAVMRDRPADSALYCAVWRLLELSGWVSGFEHCWICGSKVDATHPMVWHENQLACSSCGKGIILSAGTRKGIAAHLHRSNIRLSQQDLSSWRRMIQDVLRQHGVRPLSSTGQEQE
ncbi:MAG: DNA repair protein RecO [Mariprofundaceae bacterium]|nr:DNA repair protein RecO [Mariprofundaceae bacterium]